MKKLSRNARWHGLSPAQLKTLELWLFEDKLTYADTLQRAHDQLGFQGSLSSLKRFYQRRSHERLFDAFTLSDADATAINEAPATTASLRGAAMKMVAQLFLQQVRETPGEVEQWSMLAKVLLQSERNQIRQETRAQENELRRQKQALARDKFECNVVEEGLKAMPELQKLKRLRDDAKCPALPQSEMIRLIRIKLFGIAPEGREISPNSFEALQQRRDHEKWQEQREATRAYHQEEIERLAEEDARRVKENVK